MKRRNRKDLERKIRDAKTIADKAIAHFKLGLFHDNNSREKEAIPYYKAAISLGLNAKAKAEALAWLASSLYKTKQPITAMKYLQHSRRITKNQDLQKFLEGLEKRITKGF